MNIFGYFNAPAPAPASATVRSSFMASPDVGTRRDSAAAESGFPTSASANQQPLPNHGEPNDNSKCVSEMFHILISKVEETQASLAHLPKLVEANSVGRAEANAIGRAEANAIGRAEANAIGRAEAKAVGLVGVSEVKGRVDMLEVDVKESKEQGIATELRLRRLEREVQRLRSERQMPMPQNLFLPSQQVADDDDDWRSWAIQPHIMPKTGLPCKRCLQVKGLCAQHPLKRANM